MNGTGRAGSWVYVSAGSSFAGGSVLSRPSPSRLFAVPPLCRKYSVKRVRASGHSRSSRHTFVPITKIRTGACSFGLPRPSTESSQSAR